VLADWASRIVTTTLSIDADAGLKAEEIAPERIIAITAGARPVARIRDNQATIEFLGPDSESWAKVITQYKPLIDRAIPAVGRIELNNSDYSWVGTGWMIAQGIIVTNRHVADVFARLDRKTSRLVFRPGLMGGLVSADIDFLEEEGRLNSAEHPITSILWIASEDEADVAFLQVSKASERAPLPKQIELAEEITEGGPIAAIGYPARDPSIPDQNLVIRIFGPDVYDKKAPVTRQGDARERQHDRARLLHARREFRIGAVRLQDRQSDRDPSWRPHQR
jgi:S1-C subfamily serine protease